MKLILYACVTSCVLLSVFAQPMPGMEEDEPEIMCPRDLCAMYCPNGYLTSEHGCPLCECLTDPCTQVEGVCEPYEKCTVKHLCTEHPCTHEHVIAECGAEYPSMCPMPMCSDDCVFGYKNYASGCMSCDCKESVCEGYSCPLDQQCVPMPQPLDTDEYKPICIHSSQTDAFLNRFGNNPEVEPEVDPEPVPLSEVGICDLVMEHLRNGNGELRDTEGMHRVPMDHLHASMDNCNEDGSFKPVHCNRDTRECWCVNDHGEMIPGTSGPMSLSRNMHCEEHSTTSSEIVMVFSHDIEGDIQEHLQAIRRMIRAKLAELLQMNMEMIVVKEITGDANRQEVRIVIELRSDGEIHLPQVLLRLALMMTRESVHIQYGEYTLTPTIDRFDTTHYSSPHGQHSSEEEGHRHHGSDSSSSSSSESGELSSETTRIWKKHPGLAIGAGVSGGLIILGLAGLCVTTCCVKRGHAQFSHTRLDNYNYKENLAYSHDAMNSHPDVLIKDKSSRSDSYEVTLPETQDKY